MLTGAYLRAYAGYAPLVLRIVTGAIFAIHGYQKFSGGLEGVAGFLASLGFPIPAVFAVILVTVELLGGIALVLGVFTRLAAQLCAIVAAVGLVTVHLPNGFFISNGGYEFILLLLSASISLALTGSGRFSLDEMMER